MNNPSNIKFTSATELLNSLFDKELTEKDYDNEIVDMVKQHLGQTSIHSKAGSNLGRTALFYSAGWVNYDEKK